MAKLYYSMNKLVILALFVASFSMTFVFADPYSRDQTSNGFASCATPTSQFMECVIGNSIVRGFNGIISILSDILTIETNNGIQAHKDALVLHEDNQKIIELLSPKQSQQSQNITKLDPLCELITRDGIAQNKCKE